MVCWLNSVADQTRSMTAMWCEDAQIFNDNHAKSYTIASSFSIYLYDALFSETEKLFAQSRDGCSQHGDYYKIKFRWILLQYCVMFTGVLMCGTFGYLLLLIGDCVCMNVWFSTQIKRGNDRFHKTWHWIMLATKSKIRWFKKKTSITHIRACILTYTNTYTRKLYIFFYSILCIPVFHWLLVSNGE